MSKKQPPRVQFDFEPDPIIEEDYDIQYDIQPNISQEIEDYGLSMPEVIEEPIVEKEIFDMGEEPAFKNKKIREDYETKKPVKINKNGKPRKPMSADHRAKLDASRKKALEVRKIKAEERKNAKELENEERELLKAQKVKRVQKLRQEVSGETPDPPQPAPTPHRPELSTQSFTREDLEKAQLDAIIKYEALRKSRKEEKKQKEMLEKQHQDMRDRLKRATEPQAYTYRATNSNGRYVNPWDKCY
jgi:hypothetical protein